MIQNKWQFVKKMADTEAKSVPAAVSLETTPRFVVYFAGGNSEIHTRRDVLCLCLL